MPGPDFLDTNVLVDAYDVSDPDRQRIAQGLVRKAAGEIVMSAQVLAEFAATLLRKISPPAIHTNLMVLLDALSPIKLIPIDADTVRRAVEVRTKYGLHFYDGMIVAAAELGGCGHIWSEDLTAGQQFSGLLYEIRSLHLQCRDRSIHGLDLPYFVILRGNGNASR